MFFVINNVLSSEYDVLNKFSYYYYYYAQRMWFWISCDMFLLFSNICLVIYCSLLLSYIVQPFQSRPVSYICHLLFNFYLVILSIHCIDLLKHLPNIIIINVFSLWHPLPFSAFIYNSLCRNTPAAQPSATASVGAFQH